FHAVAPGRAGHFLAQELHRSALRDPASEEGVVEQGEPVRRSADHRKHLARFDLEIEPGQGGLAPAPLRYQSFRAKERVARQMGTGRCPANSDAARPALDERSL